MRLTKQQLIDAFEQMAAQVTGDAQIAVRAAAQYAREEASPRSEGVPAAIQRITGWPLDRVTAALSVVPGPISIHVKPVRHSKDVTLHGPGFAIPLLWFEVPTPDGQVRAGVAEENMTGIGATLNDWMPLEVRWTEGAARKALPFKGTLKAIEERGSGPGLKMDEFELVLLMAKQR